MSKQSDGLTAEYYELPKGATELQHLISAKNMNAQLGEIFRACYRYGEVAHSPRLRDIKKIISYALAEYERVLFEGVAKDFSNVALGQVKERVMAALGSMERLAADATATVPTDPTGEYSLEALRKVIHDASAAHPRPVDSTTPAMRSIFGTAFHDTRLCDKGVK